MVHICFHINQFGFRGTEVAIYQYAHYNEVLLGNRSSIIAPVQAPTEPEVKKKFSDRFAVYQYHTLEELDLMLENMHADALYVLKAGQKDDLVAKKIPTYVHVVFRHFEPHGTVYAYISEWLSREMSRGKQPFVPHIVEVQKTEKTLTEILNIPKNAIVFGRHGGHETFDIPFVKRAVYKIASGHPNIYFLFMNTENFISSKKGFFKKNKFRWLARILFPKNHFPNVIFLDATTSDMEKSIFIHTCHAMLHARRQGESFGLACGEFSVCNKPVITWKGDKHYESAHLEILGNRGIYYKNASDLKKILTTFKPPHSSENFDAYSHAYNPSAVMQKFKQVFLHS